MTVMPDGCHDHLTGHARPDWASHKYKLSATGSFCAESFFFIGLGLDSSVNLSPKSDRGVLKKWLFAGYLPHLGNFKGVFRPRCIHWGLDGIGE